MRLSSAHRPAGNMSQLFVSQIEDGITIQTFYASDDAAVELWAEDLIRTIEQAPAAGFTVLMDVSSNKVSFTRHARHWSMEIFTRYKTRKGRIALLFSSRTSPYFARIFFASLGRLNFSLSFFSSREKALEWLRDDQKS